MMKKLLLVCCIAFAALAVCSSCSSDKDGTHEYLINMGRSRVMDKQAYNKIMEYIGQDPYFSSRPQYTGKFTECTERAIEEFKEHCNRLDSEYICSLLTDPVTDVFIIDFWSCDPMQNWISTVFRPDFVEIKDGDAD